MPSAPTMVSGIRAQDSFSTNREKRDFAEGIALLDPNENPFTLLSIKVGRGTSGNIKHSWLEDQLVPETDAVDTGGDSEATTIGMTNGGKFKAGDVVIHEDTKEQMLVTSVSTNTITVTRDYGQASESYTALADTVSDGDYLRIIGNAFMQGHNLPTERSTKEVERYNYCQEQRTPIGISWVAAAAAVHGAPDWPHQLRKAGISHQRKIEYQNIWGKPYQGSKALSASGTTNDHPVTGAGIWHYMSEYADAVRKKNEATITQNEFLEFIEAGFEYGSSQKVMFCAPILRTALDFWGISKLNTFSEKTLYGMNVAKWVSSHGTILFVTHKMLKPASSSYGAYNFLLDMNNIKWITYSNIGSTQLRRLDPYKATGRTVDQAEYMTNSCIEFKLPDTHAVLYGVTDYAA
jgi:hypothetical protein